VSSSYSTPAPVETRRQYEYHTEQRIESSGRPGSSYSTEKVTRTSSSSDGRPGGYHSSYSTTTSGRLPGGTPTYRHYSYRV